MQVIRVNLISIGSLQRYCNIKRNICRGRCSMRKTYQLHIIHSYTRHKDLIGQTHSANVLDKLSAVYASKSVARHSRQTDYVLEILYLLNEH